MRPYIHPRTADMLGLAELIDVLARTMIREARKRRDAKRPRVRRGATVRPGPDTPLWNALVSMTKPHLRRWGDRAILARELDLHRARMGEFFDTQSAMPDAERALRLLIWLSDRMPEPAAPAAKAKVRNPHKRP